MQKQLETHGGVLRLFFLPVKNHLLGGAIRNAFTLLDTEFKMLTEQEV